MQDEILDLVDNNDRVIGQIPRNEAFKKGITRIRVVVGFIENDKGQLWIPRRTATKRIFPLALDFSIAGCVGTGESYEQAFEREALEEVNMDITQLPYRELAYLSPHEHDLVGFTKVYSLHLNTIPNYNTDDFCESYWLKPQELAERIKHDAHKDDLPTVLKAVFSVE